jgi:cytochrome c-type biogenesis protein CcmH
MLLTTAVEAVDPTQMPTPALQTRYLSLTHELRCMQCQNEAIADSPVDLAADLRRQVHDMLIAGKTDDDVRNFMVARYGEFILFRPRMSLRTAWLWLAPGVLILVGAFVAVRIVQQRSALVTQDNEPLEEDIRS